MKFLHQKIITTGKFLVFLILIAVIFSLQGCFFEDEEPGPENVCAGLSNEYATNATAAQCEVSGGEWIEESCYCHGS